MLNRITNKKRILLLSIAAVLVIGIGGTLAYLVTKTDEISNNFNPSQVSCEVKETLDVLTKTKENVYILNTSDIPAYIRAEVVITWQDEEGNVFGRVPIKGTDYEIKYGDSAWIEDNSNGIYYWPHIVSNVDDSATESKEDATGILISSVKPLGNAPDGYSLCVEILGSAIQADGVNGNGIPAVVDAWEVTYNEETKMISK